MNESCSISSLAFRDVNFPDFGHPNRCVGVCHFNMYFSEGICCWSIFLYVCLPSIYHSIFIVKQRFLSSFQICIPFILLSWHIALAGTSVMMLKGWLREGILALYLILVGKLWIYHLKYTVSSRFFVNSLYEVKKVSLLPILLRDFIVCVRFCQITFCIYWYDHVVFLI